MRRSKVRVLSPAPYTLEGVWPKAAEKCVKLFGSFTEPTLEYGSSVKFAFEAYDAGMRRIGIAFLIERIRWEEEVVRRTDGYKINNNHKPFYSRRLMRKHPELNGLFVTRKRTST